MARLTARQMASKLRAQGHRVELLERKEGGTRISRIDGKHYIGSTGNKVARELLGVDLSEVQKKHLESIRQKKGVFGKKRKEPLPEDLLRLQNKINRQFKKQGKGAKVTRSKIRYRLEHKGEAETRKYLNRALRYAGGYTYDEALEVFIQRLELDLGIVPANEIQLVQSVIDKAQRVMNQGKLLKRSDFDELISWTYQWEYSVSRGLNLIPTKQWRTGALKILNRAE